MKLLGALTPHDFCDSCCFLPAILITGIAVHLFVLRRVGPAGPWTDDRASLGAETFAPRQVYMDAVVIVCIFGRGGPAFTIPLPLTDKANPSDTSFVPVPEWYFSSITNCSSTYMDRLNRWRPGCCRALCDPGHVVLAVYRSQPRAKSYSGGPSRLAAVCCFSVVFGLLGISIKNLYAVPRTDLRGQRKDGVCATGLCRLPPDPWEGGAVAPDLSTIGDMRPDRIWHLKHFRDPQSVSPGSFMPKFPLTEQQLNDLTSYMLSLKRTT